MISTNIFSDHKSCFFIHHLVAYRTPQMYGVVARGNVWSRDWHRECVESGLAPEMYGVSSVRSRCRMCGVCVESGLTSGMNGVNTGTGNVWSQDRLNIGMYGVRASTGNVWGLD